MLKGIVVKASGSTLGQLAILAATVFGFGILLSLARTVLMLGIIVFYGVRFAWNTVTFILCLPWNIVVFIINLF